MGDRTQNSTLFRILFSLFIAIVACGMSFYLILFVSLAVTALTHSANPANTPAFTANLRHVVLPLCAVIGVVVFMASYRRSGRWNRPDEKNESKKAAVQHQQFR